MRHPSAHPAPLPGGPSASAPAAAADYVRRARRLRHVLRKSPGHLHESLRVLARQYDRGELSSIPLPEQCRHSQAGDFAARVAAAMEGPILRYSRRQALLREAQRRGIGRFEANLIIAAVQHRCPAAPHPVHTSHRSPLAPLAAFFALQSAIVLACWYLLS